MPSNALCNKKADIFLNPSHATMPRERGVEPTPSCFSRITFVRIKLLKQNFGQSYTISGHIRRCVNLEDVAQKKEIERSKVGGTLRKLCKNAVYFRFFGFLNKKVGIRCPNYVIR